MRKTHDHREYDNEEKIREVGLVRCPSCKYVFVRLSAHRRCNQREGGQEIVEDVEWKESPWPKGTPLPPKGMPHPSAFAQRKKLYSTVPPAAKQLWVDLLTSVFTNFADVCQESDNDSAKAEALTALVGLSRVLERGRGGKSGNRKLRGSMHRFASAVEILVNLTLDLHR
jgi:hypothetical protein